VHPAMKSASSQGERILQLKSAHPAKESTLSQGACWKVLEEDAGGA